MLFDAGDAGHRPLTHRLLTQTLNKAVIKVVLHIEVGVHILLC